MGTTLIRSRLKGADPSKLTAGERRFVSEMLATGMSNVAEAARRAWPNCKTPAQYGNKVLKRKRVAAILGKEQRLALERAEISANEVLRQLHHLLTRSGADLFDERGVLVLNHRVVGGRVEGATVHDLPERVQQSIEGVKQKVRRYLEDDVEVEEMETELKLAGKISAVEMAMKHKGLFAPDKLMVAGVTSPSWDDLLERAGEPIVVDGNVIDAESAKEQANA